MRYMKPYAVFDIDGTLLRWQLYHAILDALNKAGLISTQSFTTVRAARMHWKQRSADDSYANYEHAVVDAFDGAITGISYTDYMSAVENVLEEYKGQSYTYTRDLIRALKEQGYLVFAISASQFQAVELLAKHYGFDDWGGSVYHLENGRFTGKKDIMKRDKKPLYLQTLIDKHGASKQGSMAIGDSDSDIPMLSAVEQPIAFNPNKMLFEHAQRKGWDIVIERKNMIYKLVRKEGEYVVE
jgi:HAD superfamily hydrolase (TIGR01490 family)